VPRHGASPEEWAHWSLVLGLGDDLLPVVSNPEAQISAKSKLTTLGKIPSRYDADRKVVGIAEWPTYRASDRQIEAWSREGDYGICLITRTVRAIDIDCEDLEAVNRIRILAYEHLGALPVRVRAGAHRVALLFRCSTPLSKRIVVQPSGAVELLGDGQQILIAGRHPKGGRYGFERGLPDEIPEVQHEALEAFWAAIGGAVVEGRTARIRQTSDARNGVPPSSVARGEDSVRDWLKARGWVRDERRDGGLDIYCPWQDEHTGDSGTSETSYFAPGTGGFEQGHFRCLHAHCAGRTDEQFLEAIGWQEAVAGDFEALPTLALPSAGPMTPAVVTTAGGAAGQGSGANGSAPPAWGDRDSPYYLRRDRSGYRINTENVVRALATPGFWYRLGFDEFYGNEMFCGWEAPAGAEPWQPVADDDFYTRAIIALEHAGFKAVGVDLMRRAVRRVARENSFDSARTWLSRLEWDGVARVEGFLDRYCGASFGSYTWAVSKYLWTALAGRLLVPGIQCDMVPILVGGQGVGKTRGIEAMAPFRAAYTTLDLALKHDERGRQILGKVVVEIAELTGLHTRDKTEIKKFISERADTWTPKYQERSQTHDRRCVFIGTTNDQEFLDDETGNRRWLPIRVGQIDVEAIARDKDQLWAEGAMLFRRDGIVWREVSELAPAEHDQFLIEDAWEESVQLWAQNQWIRSARSAQVGLFSTRDAAIAIGIEEKQINRSTEMRVAKILRKLGYSKVRTRTAVGTESAQKYLWSHQ